MSQIMAEAIAAERKLLASLLRDRNLARELAAKYEIDQSVLISSLQEEILETALWIETSERSISENTIPDYASEID